MTLAMSQMSRYSLSSALLYGHWSKLVYCKGNREPFGKQPLVLDSDPCPLERSDTICDLGGVDELANYGEYSGAPSEQQTYDYAKTILSLMTREKHHKGGHLLSFPNPNYKLYHLVGKCITDPRSTSSVNFTLHLGTRQGCPLAPLIVLKSTLASSAHITFGLYHKQCT